MAAIDPEEAAISDWLGEGAKVVETACARVFLYLDHALKLKRRVDLNYLDFTGLAARVSATERELAFNRATAPDIYRAVRQVTRRAGGGFELDGPGEVVDAVLEMRRFDERCVLSAIPEAVDGDLAEKLGRRVATAHAEAELRPAVTGAASLQYVADSNATLFRALAPTLDAQAVERLVAATNAGIAQQAALLDARAAAGLTRRCHGDLHLGNILLEHGEPVLFDCIEFSDKLSDIDVQYDLAFLLMDLDMRGRRDAAARVLAAYLDEAGRSFGMERIEGLAAMPLMLSLRAGVRAHVSANGGDAAAGRAYLAAAQAHLDPPPAKLVAVGGLSGSGKTTFARAVAPRLGGPAGALVLRSDEARKRLMGVEPHTRLPSEGYDRAVTDRVHDLLFAEAEAALCAGRAVVLDATFMDAEVRARAAAAAKAAGVPFRGVWLKAPAEVLASRIEGRRSDASDATVEVLASQQARDLGEIEWPQLDVSGATDAAVERWLAPGR